MGARRLPPPRRRPVAADFSWQLARRFHLSAVDYAEVQQAVSQGRAASSVRLQPVAHALSEHILSLDLLGRPRARRRLTQAQLLALRVAAGLAALGLAAVAINRHAYGSVVTPLLWGIVYPFVLRSAARRRRHAVQAALTANAAPLGDEVPPPAST